MTRPLLALFVLLEGLDLATYLQAPHLEANPAMAALPPLAVALVKVGVVAVVALLLPRIQTPTLRGFALGACIAIAAFGVGANVAVLSLR